MMHSVSSVRKEKWYHAVKNIDMSYLNFTEKQNEYFNRLALSMDEPGCHGVVWPKRRNAGAKMMQLRLTSEALRKGDTVFYYGTDPEKELPVVIQELKSFFDVSCTFEIVPDSIRDTLSTINDSVLQRKPLYIIKAT